MNSSVWRNRFRVEDALCLMVVLFLLGFAATGTSLDEIPVLEERLWLVSFTANCFLIRARPVRIGAAVVATAVLVLIGLLPAWDRL